ncbi:hypothetical protein [Flavobacterium sp. 3HN19-14]|uniref:hypothetical protein n=1 Tax=Flavobacterium sp. 3HN19-14 TaxID=3448133 RepID=UPI003EE088B9
MNNTAARFLVSGTNNAATAEYASPKCIKADGDVTINGGTFTLSVTNQNATCLYADSVLNINGELSYVPLAAISQKDLPLQAT